MVKKILDPRLDNSAVAMRSIRAKNVYKGIVKHMKKYKNFYEDKLNLNKEDDSYFYQAFIDSPDLIKQELIFLWEEVGILLEQDDSVQIDISHESPTIPDVDTKKRKYIFAP